MRLNRRDMLRAGLLLLVLLLVVPVGAGAQALVELVGPTAQIPRDGYRTWTLFLVCNPAWVAPEQSGALRNLYRRFKIFGDAIGKDNLAVWFWTRRTTIDDPRLAENVDVARSAEFCRRLTLRPTAGPFLVITSAYPDLEAFPRDRTVFELGGLPPEELASLLNRLTDELLLEGKAEAARRSSASGAPDSPIWMRLLEGAQRSLIGFGCGVVVKVDTGMLSAELRACPGQ